VALIVLSLLTFALPGCGPKQARAPVVGALTTEQLARGVYEKLGAFIGQAQKNHPECSADRPAAKEGICPALHSSIDAQNALGDAINVYCSGVPLPGSEPYGVDQDGDGRGGPCAPVLGAERNLESLMANGLAALVAAKEAIR